MTHQYPQQYFQNLVKWGLLRQNQKKKVLKKGVSSWYIKKEISTVALDASAILYLFPWPTNSATVGDFVVKFRNYTEKQLQNYDICLVFDLYRENSLKVLQEFHVELI